HPRMLGRQALQEFLGHAARVKIAIAEPVAMLRIDDLGAGGRGNSAAIVLAGHAGDRLMEQDHVPRLSMAEQVTGHAAPVHAREDEITYREAEPAAEREDRK